MRCSSPNLFIFIRDSVDPSGLWGNIIFDGPFTNFQKAMLDLAVSHVGKRALGMSVEVLAAWRALKDIAFLANKACCALVNDLVDHLDSLGAVLTRMNAYYVLDAQDLQFINTNLGKPLTVAQTKWSWLSFGDTGEIFLNSGGAPVNWAGLNQSDLDQLIFHEQSHLFGTDDGEDNNNFNDAHMIEWLMHQNLNQTFWFKGPLLTVINCLKNNGNPQEAATLQQLMDCPDLAKWGIEYIMNRSLNLPD